MTDRSSLTILPLSTRLILGGSQENTVLSCEGQAELGHDVHLAYGPIFGPEGSLFDRANAFRTADGRRITMHELPHLVREISPVKDHHCFHKDLKNLIREINPDVIHTHSSKAGILGRWAGWTARDAQGQRPAVVHTIHGPPFMPAEGSPIARTKTAIVNRVYTHAERFAANRCDVIASVADAMTAQFLARGIGRPEQYITVRSGMETGPFLTPAPGEDRAAVRAELGIPESDFVVGTVARLAQHKGHDDLLDAMAEPMRTRPDIRLLWVLKNHLHLCRISHSEGGGRPADPGAERRCKAMFRNLRWGRQWPGTACGREDMASGQGNGLKGQAQRVKGNGQG